MITQSNRIELPQLYILGNKCDLNFDSSTDTKGFLISATSISQVRDTFNQIINDLLHRPTRGNSFVSFK